jgi:CDP-diacylglycerol--serine O-phosphatidyltransferase
MKLLRHLPNALTLCNLLFGVLAIMALTNDMISTTMLLMAGSLVADALDGAIARKLGVDGALGLQLDSLADMVTFGVLPAMMLYYAGVNYGDHSIGLLIIALFASLSAVSAGLRLGRFNIDVRSKEYFWGLATPAGALMVASWLWAQHTGHDFGLGVSSIPELSIIIPIFLAVFYQVTLKLPSLKSSKPGLATLILLAVAILIGTFLYGTIAIFIGIVLYILLGLLNLLLKLY